MIALVTDAQLSESAHHHAASQFRDNNLYSCYQVEKGGMCTERYTHLLRSKQQPLEKFPQARLAARVSPSSPMHSAQTGAAAYINTRHNTARRLAHQR
jgi:hypothetical protein